MNYPIYLGCTATRHAQIGIDAIVNARGNEQWRNDREIEEIEMIRDGRKIKAHLTCRVRFYQFNSKFFRDRKITKVKHLLSDHNH